MYIHGKRKRFTKRIPTWVGSALPGELKISLDESAFRKKKRSDLDKVSPSLLHDCCAAGFRSRKAAAVLKAHCLTNIQHLYLGDHSLHLEGLQVDLNRR